MNFVSHVGDIVDLGSGERFAVLDCIEYEGKGYLYILEMPDKPDDFDKIMQNHGFAEEKVVGEKYFLSAVSDEKLINKLKSIIKENKKL